MLRGAADGAGFSRHQHGCKEPCLVIQIGAFRGMILLHFLFGFRSDPGILGFCFLKACVQCFKFFVSFAELAEFFAKRIRIGFSHFPVRQLISGSAQVVQGLLPFFFIFFKVFETRLRCPDFLFCFLVVSLDLYQVFLCLFEILFSCQGVLHLLCRSGQFFGSCLQGGACRFKLLLFFSGGSFQAFDTFIFLFQFVLRVRHGTLRICIVGMDSLDLICLYDLARERLLLCDLLPYLVALL